MSIPDVDLAEIVAMLRRNVPPSACEGLLDGKTAFRNAVADHLGCSESDAEDIVDTLVSRHMIRFEKDPRKILPDRWVL